MHSLSTHHYADGGVGEVFVSTKHSWSFWGKLYCSQIQYNWSKRDNFFRRNKTTEKTRNMPPYCSPADIQVSVSPYI